MLSPSPPHPVAVPAPSPSCPTVPADAAVPRWRREVRIKKGNHRWQGETWYYGPCGKRMKQFPEVIKVPLLGTAGCGAGPREGSGSSQPPPQNSGLQLMEVVASPER